MSKRGNESQGAGLNVPERQIQTAFYESAIRSPLDSRLQKPVGAAKESSTREWNLKLQAVPEPHGHSKRLDRQQNLSQRHGTERHLRSVYKRGGASVRLRHPVSRPEVLVVIGIPQARQASSAGLEISAKRREQR